MPWLDHVTFATAYTDPIPGSLRTCSVLEIRTRPSRTTTQTDMTIVSDDEILVFVNTSPAIVCVVWTTDTDLFGLQRRTMSCVYRVNNRRWPTRFTKTDHVLCVSCEQQTLTYSVYKDGPCLVCVVWTTDTDLLGLQRRTMSCVYRVNNRHGPTRSTKTDHVLCVSCEQQALTYSVYKDGPCLVCVVWTTNTDLLGLQNRTMSCVYRVNNKHGPTRSTKTDHVLCVSCEQQTRTYSVYKDGPCLVCVMWTTGTDLLGLQRRTMSCVCRVNNRHWPTRSTKTDHVLCVCRVNNRHWPTRSTKTDHVLCVSCEQQTLTYSVYKDGPCLVCIVWTTGTDLLGLQRRTMSCVCRVNNRHGPTRSTKTDHVLCMSCEQQALTYSVYKDGPCLVYVVWTTGTDLLGLQRRTMSCVCRVNNRHWPTRSTKTDHVLCVSCEQQALTYSVYKDGQYLVYVVWTTGTDLLGLQRRTMYCVCRVNNRHGPTRSTKTDHILCV